MDERINRCRRDKLILYAYGKLDAASAAKVEDSLADDEPARRVVAACRGLDHASDGLVHPDPPAALRDRVLAAVEKAPRRGWAGWVGAIAAAAVVLCMIMIGRTPPPAPVEPLAPAAAVVVAEVPLFEDTQFDTQLAAAVRSVRQLRCDILDQQSEFDRHVDEIHTSLETLAREIGDPIDIAEPALEPTTRMQEGKNDDGKIVCPLA